MPTAFDIDSPPRPVAVRPAGRPRKDPGQVANPGVTSIYFGDRIDSIREAANNRGVSMSEFVTDAAEVASGINPTELEELKALAILRRVSVADLIAGAVRGLLAAARG